MTNTRYRVRSYSIRSQLRLTSLDISLRNGHNNDNTIPKSTTLRFLSVVETCRIPLYLALGSPCLVSTPDSDTERWFSHMLLNKAHDSPSSGRLDWWRSTLTDSTLGILVSVQHLNPNLNPGEPRATEILFYASHKADHVSRPPTPPNSTPSSGDIADEPDVRPFLEINALLLSSDLFQQFRHCEQTPPGSPTDQACPASFLPPLQTAYDEIINEPPVRKRKTANDAFDEANERRKKARRKGGEGVVAAAAPKLENRIQPLQHRRSASTSQTVALQTRPLSRSPSVASSRPATANRPSTLSKVESGEAFTEQCPIERKNKDIVSRIVMTGMRLHGLAQSKKRSMRGSSTAPSPVVDASFDDVESDRKNDEEYKVIYHQVLKGTCLAFRATIGHESLQPFSSQIRDVVDQLLVIFCTNPLANGRGKSEEKMTPGGRKAFGAGGTEESNSQFETAPG